MAVYDVSPYLGTQTGRTRTMSSGTPYPASRSGYASSGGGGFSLGDAAITTLRTSPFGSIFSPLSLFSSFAGGGGQRFSGQSARVSPRVAEGRVTAQSVASATTAPRTATADDYRQFLSGTAAGLMPSTEEQPFIGGFPSDFVYETQVPAQRGAGPLEGNEPRRTSSTLYGRPLYREGAAYAFLSDLGQEGVRSWQAFFAGLGFETGPSGMITQNDIAAMNAFMGMANGTPGGGMKVETLRNLVMDQVQAGVYFFRGVNESGDLLPPLLGESPAGDLTSGGGGGVGDEFLGPVTETVTRNIVQEISTDQGLLALRNIVANEIGRAPTDDEVREFVRRVNSAYRADPTVITQVTTTDPVTRESTTDITESETSVSPEGMAVSFTEEDLPEEERYEYQASRYFDALMSAIGM